MRPRVTRMPRAVAVPIALTTLVFMLLEGVAMPVAADEGMWLPTDPPTAKLRANHQFDLTPEFAGKLMRASVRFPGASGGFVSPEGLVVTNHHVGSDAIAKLSTPGRDLLKGGFMAATRADELKCPDVELNVLRAIRDVTAEVNAGVKPNTEPADAASARRAAMAKIEQDESGKSGLKCEVVTLYQGGLYHLYCYKKYTDVRLVFAPEEGIAAFGGDVDNFEYPRFALDVSFFRAYENDKPANTPDYFQWSKVGPTVGELVLVTGHPGTTNRLETHAKLVHRRDITLPYDLARLRALEAALIQFSEESPEQRRQGANALHGVANRRKAYAGQLQGLLTASILAQKAESDAELGATTNANSPWGKVAAAEATFAAFEPQYLLLERGDGFASEPFAVARHLVRLAAELPKPNGGRLREYRDSALPSLKLTLFSPAPVYPALEARKLQTALTFLAEKLGGGHPLIVKVLAGKSPNARAAELVAGTKLMDPAERKKLFDGGAKAIEASDDPLIALAKLVDAEARSLRGRYETEVEEPQRQAYAEIATLRFAKLGKAVAPDATFTLRLAFGVVKGYTEDGVARPPFTTMAGLYERAALMGGAPPFDLPPRWREGKSKLDLATPMDFVSTADTIGGNSGSPVLNRAGELVGVNFDRNRPGLVRNFVYTEVEARHIAVHSRAVIEALTKLYGAAGLVGELVGE